MMMLMPAICDNRQSALCVGWSFADQTMVARGSEKSERSGMSCLKGQVLFKPYFYCLDPRRLLDKHRERERKRDRNTGDATSILVITLLHSFCFC